MKFFDSKTNEVFCTEIAIQNLKNMQESMMHTKIKIISADIKIDENILLEFNEIINKFNKVIHKLDDEIQLHINLMYQNQIENSYQNSMF